MGLKDLNLKLQYRSDIDNLAKSFYEPCIKNSILYDRASGYFTSSSLKTCAQGLEVFIKKNSKMRLIVSPKLEKEDIEAIKRGIKSKQDVIEDALIRELKICEDNIKNKTLYILSWLIYRGKLEIKIAVLKNLRQGIYHEKFGVFSDEIGNKIAFTGSANETEGGYLNNFESIDVYISENQRELERINLKQKNFNDMWVNNTKDLDVIDFPEAVKKRLLEYKDEKYKLESSIQEESRSFDTIIKPNFLQIREYQKDAINSWIKNNGCGILEMATGTGKTITALYLVYELYNRFRKLAVIIVCPYQHLVNQWNDESKLFNIKSVLCFGNKNNWEVQLKEEINNFNMNISSYISIIVTNTSFCNENFQEIIENIKQPSILIFDEAHHIGTENFIKYIPSKIKFRLGLSATPNRWYDNKGNKILNDYFKGVVYKFPIEKAIGEFLTPYFYYPHIVYFTDKEAGEYYKLSVEIAKFSGMDKDLYESNKTIKMLLIKRAKLIGKAENKIIELRKCLQGKENSKYNLFYTGDGKTDDERQIEKVIKMLGCELNMRVSKFTSEESKEERQQIIKAYEQGDLQGLVAIKCLDEGVNIPLIQTAYILASSTNPREFIQRRGRVLRKHPKKKHSYIHDFIVIPRQLEDLDTSDNKTFNIERNLIRKELIRISEFSQTAINGPEAQNVLLQIKNDYNLLDM